MRRRAYDLEAQECAHGRIARTGKSLGYAYDIRRSTAVLVHLQVDHVHGLPGTIAGEINDDVIPLCDAKLVRLGQRNGDRQQVAVIRYLNEPGAIAQCQNKEARHAGVQDTEAIPARIHVEEWFPGEVDSHLVGQKTIKSDIVHVELSVGVPGFVREHEVDVKVQVAPALPIGGAAGQAQVHAIIHTFIAAIQRAVNVVHAGVALVDVL